MALVREEGWRGVRGSEEGGTEGGREEKEEKQEEEEKDEVGRYLGARSWGALLWTPRATVLPGVGGG